jgi:hypothetical protein
VVSRYDDYSPAFINSKTLFLSDIPLDFKGLVSLKFPKRYHRNYISFTINQPVYVYIAVNSHYPNPLPDYFDNMQEMIQIIETKPTAKAKNVLILFIKIRKNYGDFVQEFKISIDIYIKKEELSSLLN